MFYLVPETGQNVMGIIVIIFINTLPFIEDIKVNKWTQRQMHVDDPTA